MGNLRSLVGEIIAGESTKNFLTFVIPLTLIIIATQFTRLTRSHQHASGKLPPGPPGRDHARLLDGYRWNMFKTWNDQYGSASSFSWLKCLYDNNRLYRLCSNFLYWTTAEYGYVLRWAFEIFNLVSFTFTSARNHGDSCRHSRKGWWNFLKPSAFYRRVTIFLNPNVCGLDAHRN